MTESFDELHVRSELKRAVKAAGVSNLEFARSLGIPGYFLNDMIDGRKDISVRVLNAIGFERVTRYVRRDNNA